MKLLMRYSQTDSGLIPDKSEGDWYAKDEADAIIDALQAALNGAIARLDNRQDEIDRLRVRWQSAEEQLAAADSDLYALQAEVKRLLEELRLIAVANPSQWYKEMRGQFQEWAQSRARHAIDTTPKLGSAPLA